MGGAPGRPPPAPRAPGPPGPAPGRCGRARCRRPGPGPRGRRRRPGRRRRRGGRARARRPRRRGRAPRPRGATGADRATGSGRGRGSARGLLGGRATLSCAGNAPSRPALPAAAPRWPRAPLTWAAVRARAGVRSAESSSRGQDEFPVQRQELQEARVEAARGRRRVRLCAHPRAPSPWAGESRPPPGPLRSGPGGTSPGLRVRRAEGAGSLRQRGSRQGGRPPEKLQFKGPSAPRSQAAGAPGAALTVRKGSGAAGEEGTGVVGPRSRAPPSGAGSSFTDAQASVSEAARRPGAGDPTPPWGRGGSEGGTGGLLGVGVPDA